MNDRQLKSFVLAAETRSFSKAARESYISTPALVQQINLLEISIGFELFSRTNHGIDLTPGGRQFYEKAKAILSLYDDAVSNGQKLSMQRIRLAVPPHLAPAVLFQACRTYIKQYPEAQIQYIEIPFNDHFAALQKYQIDCSFIAEPSQEYLSSLHYVPLVEDTYAFAMDHSHPLAKKPLITADMLRNICVLVGNYPYLKHPFEEKLKHTNCRLQFPKTEYTQQFKLHMIKDSEVMVFHKLWTSCHNTYLSVVPSNILAGSVGLLMRKQSSTALSGFITCLQSALLEEQQALSAST